MNRLKELFKKLAGKTPAAGVSDRINIEGLVNKLDSPWPEERDRAFNSLVSMGNSVLKKLSPFLEDKEEREKIIEVMEKIGTEGSVKTLAGSISSEDIHWNRLLKKSIRKIGKPAVRPLLKLLESQDRDLLVFAAETLGGIKDDRVVKALLKGLDKHDNFLSWLSDTRVQVAIIESLGELKSPEAVVPLLDLLGGYSNEIQKNTIKRAVAEIGSPSVDKLLEYLGGTNINLKKEIIEIAGNINDSRLVEPLMSYLKFSDRVLTDVAICAVRKKPESIKFLMEGLESEDTVFRRNCASALSKIINTESAEKLLIACGDKDEIVAGNAILALGETGGEMAMENLFALLRNPAYPHGEYVTGALFKIGDMAIPGLIASLSYKDKSVRDRAAKTLSLIGPKVFVPLIEAIIHGNEYVRESSGYIFSEFGPPVIPDLIKLLSENDEKLISYFSFLILEQGQNAVWYLGNSMMKSTDEKIRKECAALLSRIGSPALKPLLKALKDKNKSVRELAASSIADIGVSVIPELFLYLKKNEDYPEYVSITLGFMGPGAIDDLMQYMDDPDEKIRRYALDGIARMGLPAIKPLCRLIEGEDGRSQKAIMALIELLRNYMPGDKKLTTPEIDSLRDGIELLKKHRKKWGDRGEKLFSEIMKESPKDIIILFDDVDDGINMRDIEITDIS